MRSVSILMILFLGFNFAFGQEDRTINLYLKGGELKTNSIDALDTKDFEFGFEYLGQVKDTIKLTVVHHKGTVPFTRVKYFFNINSKNLIIIRDRTIKPGDQLTFTFFVDGQQIVKSYTVTSTVDQLNKPYYVDVYFVYNKDTLNTKSYILPTKLRNKKSEKFVRLEFDDPKQVPKNISIKFDKEVLTYEVHFQKDMLFHGKMILKYIDEKKLRSEYGFFKSIVTIDLDLGLSYTYSNVL